MLIPEFRRFMQADFERDGDDGIRARDALRCSTTCRTRTPRRICARSPSARGSIREWNLFLARTPLVLTPVCTELPYAHGFDVESAARTMAVWRESATLMAVPVLGLPAMAVPTGVADGCRSACRSSARGFARISASRRRRPSRRASPRITPIDPRS